MVLYQPYIQLSPLVLLFSWSGWVEVVGWDSSRENNRNTQSFVNTNKQLAKMFSLRTGEVNLIMFATCEWSKFVCSE